MRLPSLCAPQTTRRWFRLTKAEMINQELPGANVGGQKWLATHDMLLLANMFLGLINGFANQNKLKHSGKALRIEAEEIELNEKRMLGLLDAACCLVEHSLSNGRDPHPANATKKWENFDKHLHPDDAKQVQKSAHPVHCCFDAIFTTIHRGQMLNVYSAELASGMYQQASNMFSAFKFCEMIVDQPNPAPFAAARHFEVKPVCMTKRAWVLLGVSFLSLERFEVHMRSILLVFCISFPFTIIGRVSAASLMLMQSALSFSPLESWAVGVSFWFLMSPARLFCSLGITNKHVWLIGSMIG